jgi:hypothetical protein
MGTYTTSVPQPTFSSFTLSCRLMRVLYDIDYASTEVRFVNPSAFLEVYPVSDCCGAKTRFYDRG